MIIIFLPAIYTYICGRTRGVVNIVLQNIFVILQKIQSSQKNQELYKNANLDCGFLITLHKLEWFILKILAHAQKTCACGSKLILFFVVKKSGVRNLLASLLPWKNAKTKILPNFDKYFCIVVCNYVTYRQFLSSIILEFCLHIWLGAVKFQRQCQQILISHIHQDEKKKNYFLNIQSIVTEHLKEKFWI